MEVFAGIPDSVWTTLIGTVGGTVGIILGVLIAHWLSVQERRYNRKLDVLFRITRDANSLYLGKTDSLTNLCHSMNDAVMIFSSNKIRHTIASFLSRKGDDYTREEVNAIIHLMAKDIDSEIEYRSRN